jgi:RNA polymerase sigma-70 factor (ECF subfamily)
MIEPRIEVVQVVRQPENRSDAARTEAFSRLVDRPALDRAYRYATLVLGSRSDAEDATHDAALAAWRRFGELRDPDRFEAWFGRILVNACRDRLRARRRAIVSLDTATIRNPVAATPAALVSQDGTNAIAERHALGIALQSLSPEHREVVALRFYFDLPIDQIAARTDARPGTVKSRLHHAIRYLRVAIDPDNEGSVIR